MTSFALLYTDYFLSFWSWVKVFSTTGFLSLRRIEWYKTERLNVKIGGIWMRQECVGVSWIIDVVSARSCKDSEKISFMKFFQSPRTDTAAMRIFAARQDAREPRKMRKTVLILWRRITLCVGILLVVHLYHFAYIFEPYSTI